jgi:hypothetical protein
MTRFVGHAALLLVGTEQSDGAFALAGHARFADLGSLVGCSRG